jgi:hypothetical protein
MNGERPDPAPDLGPDLGKLTPAEKEALIRDLRRQVAAGRSEVRLLRRRLALAEGQSASAAEPPDKPSGALLDALRAAAPRRPAPPPSGISVKLGRSFGLWRSPVVLGVIGVILLAFAIDGGVGIYQTRALQQQRQARLQLEHEALTSLYVELKQIVQEPDGKSYRMTITMQNVDPAAPLYVMLNAVEVFVQSGMTWQQVPSRPVQGTSWGVVKLVDAYSYGVSFAPDVAHWAELIPGYMHVRIQSDMLISRRAQPGDDVAERRTPFYVYLKPYGANDADIKARSKMSGTPPVFIPMPPH